MEPVRDGDLKGQESDKHIITAGREAYTDDGRVTRVIPVKTCLQISLDRTDAMAKLRAWDHVHRIRQQDFRQLAAR